MYLQAGYNPLMLAVANNIKISDYRDVLCNLVDKTGVNLVAEKVILCFYMLGTYLKSFVMYLVEIFVIDTSPAHSLTALADSLI